MAKSKLTPEERFWLRVIKTDGCWVWTGCVFKLSGYGYFKATPTSSALAHRHSFFWAYGYYPKEACHTCDNRLCVRPDHMYDGTRSSNMLDASARGRHGMSRRTHCINGHAFTDDNTRLYRRPSDGGTTRQCRECQRAHDKRARQKPERKEYKRIWRRRRRELGLPYV